MEGRCVASGLNQDLRIRRFSGLYSVSSLTPWEYGERQKAKGEGPAMAIFIITGRVPG
jgi:hypothetical protein